MRILILTCATGGGHLRAAAALEKYIRETTTHEVIQMDFLKSIGKLLDKTICDSYLFMAKKTPSLFGRLYKTTNKDNPLADFVPRTTELLALQLYPRLAEVAPDVIISVHPFATEMISGLKERRRITCPLICIMTDYGVHKAWIAPNVDAYVVACDDMVNDLRRLGIPKEHIYPYGIPVHDVFFDKEDQAKLLTEMDLESEVPTVLFMAGSMGVSNIVDLYRGLCSSPLDLQIIIITGNNKKLYKLFESEIPNSSKKTKLIQFTTEVERFMHASDLIITKPGGLTVSEALACNLPLAVFDAIPGQEEDNANFLQTHDMGVRITKENFSAVVSSLIEHKERLRHMRESCRTFDKSRTAAIIVQNGKLLVTKDDSAEHYYLPGGRVTMREKAEDALTRELKEELGVTVAPERAVWIAQSFFTPTGKKQRYHELCTYFTVDASGTDLITRGDRFDSPNEPSVHFAWFPFEELPYIDLRPAFLKTEVQNLPEHTQFITIGD